jgi:hypothetical protein
MFIADCEPLADILTVWLKEDKESTLYLNPVDGISIVANLI